MLKLINVKASRQFSFPGNTVYITCTYEALSDYPISSECEMYCDFVYGYEHLPEKFDGSFRAKGKFYPQPMHLRKGESISVSLKWNVPTNAYAGTYRVKVGICDYEDLPIDIMADGKMCKRYYAGDIEVSFGEMHDFMSTHPNPIEWNLDKCENREYEKLPEIEMYVRDLQNDCVISQKVTSETGKFATEYASFDLNEIKENNAIHVVMDNVCENDGYELLCVKMPTLLNAENASFITSICGGRMVDSTNTIEWGTERKFNALNLGILCDKDEYVLFDVPYIDDNIHYSVYTRNGKRYGAIGVTLTYRIRKYGKYRSVKVINKPQCTLMRTKVLTDILHYLRKGMSRPSDFYDRGIFYYLQIQCGSEGDIYTFRDALERVKMLYNMTGGAKQVMLLRGWQWYGHDTGYPDVFKLNEKGGTMEDLKYVIEEAKKYNAVVTFHDNYDDMYEELPAYDPEIVAIDEYNEPYKAWIWISGLSRIISAPKYVKSGKMAERVKKTVEMYPVHSSYHIDVLSCEPRRYDLDENVRMAAQECVEYKKAIVREFEKYGFHVSSEGTSRPFAGLIGHAWSGYGYTEHLFVNDTFYPIIGMFFHGILPCSSSKSLAAILNGAEIIPDIDGDPRPYYKPLYYLYTLPMGMLCNEYIDEYECDGKKHKVLYSDGSIVRYDEETDDISIMNDKGKYYTACGNTLTEGFKKGEYLGYSKTGAFDFEIPFEGEIDTAYEIDFDGIKDKIEFSVNNGRISAQLQPNTAFKIILK